MKSAPHYFEYLEQAECPFFKKHWGEKLSQLMLDLTWIDELEKTDNEIYSRDKNDDDFPTFWNWPQKWQNDYNDAIRIAHKDKEIYLANAEVYRFDNDCLYILEDSEEVWFSTSSYANGDIRRMDAASGRKIEFDSAITAAYAFKNDYQDWEKNHGATYRAANILSSADQMFSDSLVGTSQECDGCAAYTKIAKDDGNIALCENCAS